MQSYRYTKHYRGTHSSHHYEKVLIETHILQNIEHECKQALVAALEAKAQAEKVAQEAALIALEAATIFSSSG